MSDVETGMVVRAKCKCHRDQLGMVKAVRDETAEVKLMSGDKIELPHSLIEVVRQ